MGIELLTIKKKAEKILKDISTKAKKGLPEDIKKYKEHPENIPNSENVLKKIYQAMEGVPNTPLDEVNMNLFSEDIGYLKSDGYIIGRFNERFILFKGRNTESLTEGDKKILKETMESFKEERLSNETDDTLEQPPFVERTQLNKTQILLRFAEEVRANELMLEIVSKYIGKSKGKKATLTDMKKLSFADVEYLVQDNPAFSKSDILNLLQYYTLKETNSSIMLKPRTNPSLSINDVDFCEDFALKEKLQSIIKEIGEIEEACKDAFLLLKSATQEENPDFRTKMTLDATFKLSKINQEASALLNKVEKSIPEPSRIEMTSIMEIVLNGSDSLSCREKEEIVATNPPDEYTTFKLKRESDILKDEDSVGLFEELGITLKKEVSISNFGVFENDKNENIENTLNNLLLYCKSLKEVTNGQGHTQKQDIKILQQGNFGI